MAGWAREIEVAVEAVRTAGALTLEYFQDATLAVELKADRTPVTAADRGAEQRIRALLEQAFPRDGILGEEQGEQVGTSGRRWIVDPIDGTQSFVRGVPLYGVLIGLEVEGECVVGAMGLPALSTTLWAARGEGAWRDGMRIRVASTRALGEATLLSSDIHPDHLGTHHAGFQRLLAACARYRGWGDCYGYAMVAMGRADIMIDPILAPWDCAAVLPILEEAGGVFVDWQGRRTVHGGNGIGTTPALLDQVRRLLGA